MITVSRDISSSAVDSVDMECTTGTIIVTGATGGLGRAIVQRLAALDQHFKAVLTVRSLEGPKTQFLRGIVGNDKRFHIWQLDLDSLECVRTFSTVLRIYISSGRFKPVSALILNAGFMSRLRPRFTQDGYEKTFQINYLANFLLVHSLLPSLNHDYCRVVLVTSFTHDPTCMRAKLLPLPRRLWTEAESLAQPTWTRKNSTRAGFKRYAASKMCLMMLMHTMQERLDRSPEFKNATFLAVDPGCIGATEIMREQNILCRIAVEGIFKVMTPLLEALFPNSLFRTPARSANDILRASLGLHSKGVEPPKAMIHNGSKLQQSSKESRDKEKQNKLWHVSAALVSLTDKEKGVIDC